MFTLRFESYNTADDEKDEVLVIQAREYRIEKSRGGNIDVIAPNSSNTEIMYPIGTYDGAYDRCFVMNDNGTTIDKISIK